MTSPGGRQRFVVIVVPLPDNECRMDWIALDGNRPCAACQERRKQSNGSYTLCAEHLRALREVWRGNNKRLKRTRREQRSRRKSE